MSGGRANWLGVPRALRMRLWAENIIHRLFGGEDNAYCRFRWCARCNWFCRISQPHESAAMEWTMGGKRPKWQVSDLVKRRPQ